LLILLLLTLLLLKLPLLNNLKHNTAKKLEVDCPRQLASSFIYAPSRGVFHFHPSRFVAPPLGWPPRPPAPPASRLAVRRSPASLAPWRSESAPAFARSCSVQKLCFCSGAKLPRQREAPSLARSPATSAPWRSESSPLRVAKLLFVPASIARPFPLTPALTKQPSSFNPFLI
jgi:hypothetical protein